PPSYQATLESSTNVCGIALNQQDLIRLIETPPALDDSFRELLQQCWPVGIQLERSYCGRPEFKLFGKPWLGQVQSHVLLIEILSFMEQKGWRYLTAADVSKKHDSKDLLFFEFTGIKYHPTIFAITFSHADCLRVISASSEVLDVVRNVLQVGGKLLQEYRHHSSREFKLLGYPWDTSGFVAAKVHVLLVNLVSALRVVGYRLHATVDMSEKGGLDSWFFRKVE
ncbi:hypothetical protein K493DRAFT_166414, partial [Basidiobolus meristosporus CBS 931.73]